jgi:hypothetical protein
MSVTMNILNKIKPYSRTEMLVVGLVFAAILLPLRLVTMAVFGESNILASVSVLACVTGFIMFGSKQGWLGKFGDMFINTILKIQKGKRRWIFFIELAFVLVIMGGAVFLIHEGDTTYSHLKDQVMAELAEMDIETQEDVMELSAEVAPEEQLEAVASMPSLLIDEFATVAVTAAIVNDMMGGWYFYFAALIVIENVQIVGFLVIARKYLKERETQEAKS